MAKDFDAGLDSDELSQFPSAASPLTAMGLDPDEVRANPDMLAKVTGAKGGDQSDVFSSNYNPLRDAGPQPSASAVSAGKAGGAAAAPAPPAPSGDGDPTDLEGYEKAGLKDLYQNSRKADQAVDQIPTTTPPDVTKLQDQEKKLATPAPLFDSKTGKRLDQTQEYNPDTGQMDSVQAKPSIGARIWRGVRGGLIGAATGGIPGAITGVIEPGDIRGGQAYGAPAPQYQRAEARRQQQLGTTEQSLQQARDNWKAQVDAAKAKATQLKDNATIGNDLAQRATSAKSEDTKATINQFKAEATADNYKAKAEEAQDKLQEQMQKNLQTAQTAEERLSIMRDSAQMADQIKRMQLELAGKKLETVTDARMIDQWQKEQIDSINKDYNGVFSSVFNRLTSGSKQERIADVNKAADGRRAALGLGTGTTAPKGQSAPSGKAVSLADARQLPQFKGKSDAEITAAIKAHGHEVRP